MQLRAFETIRYDNKVHKAAQKSELIKNEMAVRSVLTAFDQFSNPFTISCEAQDKLFCISSEDLPQRKFARTY